jgi:transcriptional regulator with XRE-family HTH domain
MDLIAERSRRGWSQAELARRSGLNAATVGLIERGRFVPYPSQLVKLGQALGLPETEVNGLLRASGRNEDRLT